MADPWHCHWADKEHKPPQDQLDRWTLSKWLSRKAKDIQEALADINHTMSIVGDKDELFLRCRAIEGEVQRYMLERFPVDIPVVVDYEPKMINALWVGSRVRELEKQRDNFSTFSYWTEPRPDKQQANQALNLVTTALGRYQTLASADWRGVAEALQEYVDSLEVTQMILVVARNDQGGPKGEEGQWSGAVARLAKKVRADLKSIHRSILVDHAPIYPALRIHPWLIDEGLDRMTLSEYREMPLSHWDGPTGGPPYILDGLINKKGNTYSFEELLEERRAAIESMLEEFRQGRFALVKGFLRRERKVWGRAQMAVAQYKRWGVWS